MDHHQAKKASRHALVGPPDLWEMKRRFQSDFLLHVGLLPGHRLLDLGCGTLRGGIPLIDYLDVGHYTGVEVRAEVLDEGRRELAESSLGGKMPRLVHCADLAGLHLGCRFDYVWAFQVLIHMEDAILETAVAVVARHLADEGVFYASVAVGEEPEGTWQGFPVVRRPATFYDAVFHRHGLTVTDIGPLAAYGHHHPRLTAAEQDRQRMLKATPA